MNAAQHVQSQLDHLAAEIGCGLGKIEREAHLRIDAVLADLGRRRAEFELLTERLVREQRDRLAAITNGEPGPPGERGPQGEQGAQGPEGPRGQDGPAGADGPMGLQGEPGPEGPTGAAGPTGPQGESGSQGAAGSDGEVGPMGAAGTPGEIGPMGPPGEMGPMGPAGEVGAVGASGPAGERGSDGMQGEMGLPGPQGSEGPMGPEGLQGASGEMGPPGSIGPEGPQGAAGKSIEGPPGPPGIHGAKGERGDVGPPGRLPKAEAWTDRVHYEADVRTHEGATWQALRDTARAPPHEDWVCLASAGQNGRDGRSFNVRSTYQPSSTDYAELDVVVLNGVGFVARRDNPGPCPGPDWQPMSPPGKRGLPGERGMRGERGTSAPAVVALALADDATLVLTNGDGSTVQLDLYPLLDKMQRGVGR